MLIGAVGAYWPRLKQFGVAVAVAECPESKGANLNRLGRDFVVVVVAVAGVCAGLTAGGQAEAGGPLAVVERAVGSCRRAPTHKRRNGCAAP